MTAAVFVVALVVVVFAVEMGGRWWRENEWKRRWRNRDRDD